MTIVPTWITCLEPETATVSFGIQSTPQSSRTFTKHLGLELNIYETYFGCKENIYITRYAPNQSGQPRVCHLPKFNTRTPRSVNDLFETVIIAVVDIGTVQITALTGRINLKSKHAQDTFCEGAHTESTQTSACVITISIWYRISKPGLFSGPRAPNAEQALACKEVVVHRDRGSYCSS